MPGTSPSLLKRVDLPDGVRETLSSSYSASWIRGRSEGGLDEAALLGDGVLFGRYQHTY